MSAEITAMLTVFAPAIVMVVGCMIEAARERLHREPIEPPSPRFAADGEAGSSDLGQARSIRFATQQHGGNARLSF